MKLQVLFVCFLLIGGGTAHASESSPETAYTSQSSAEESGHQFLLFKKRQRGWDCRKSGLCSSGWMCYFGGLDDAELLCADKDRTRPGEDETSGRQEPRGTIIGPWLFETMEDSFREAERAIQKRANGSCKSGKAKLIKYTFYEVLEWEFPGECRTTTDSEGNEYEVCDPPSTLTRYAVNGKFRCL